MKVNIRENYDAMSKSVSDQIINYINNKPESLLCLAGGDTPLKTFEYLVKADENKEVDFSKAKFVSLDEWVGLGSSTKGSCVETLYTHLYDKLSINVEKQVCFFDGLSEDLDKECKRVDEFIGGSNGIDICLLGIGMNGHLGFNEPNVDPELKCSVIPLDPVTKTVGAKYFDEDVNVTAGITVGLKHLLASKELILIANAEKKAEIVKKTIEGKITIEVPSTMARKNENSVIYLDEEAASKLEK